MSLKYIFISALLAIHVMHGTQKIVPLETQEQLESAIANHNKVMVLFLGSCEHCPIGKNCFETFVNAIENDSDINYFTITRVDSKPEIIQKYNAQTRPTLHVYLAQTLLQALTRTEITFENLRILNNSLKER